jgi:hypothetical protein
MLESRKLRTLMDLVAIEPPALGVPLSGKTAELSDVFLDGGPGSETLQIMTDELVQAHPLTLGDLLGSLGELLVDG